MHPALRKLLDYKWSIVGGLAMFIFCLLIINVGFWIALVVLLVTVIGAVVGYVVDAKIDIKSVFKKF